jgi:hypothetical protein
MSWTIKTLKQYFEQRFDSMDRARKLARKLMNRRLDNMNEIREQLDRQIETFVSKSDLKLFEQKLEALSKMVYIGFGIFLVLQIILVYIMAKVF